MIGKYISIFLLLSLCVVSFSACSGAQKNNPIAEQSFTQEAVEQPSVQKLESLITKSYPPEKIAKVCNVIDNKNCSYTLADLEKSFELQCIRETYQGFYTVLLQDNGKFAFFFADQQGQLYDYYIVDKFFTQQEFEVMLEKEPTLFQMLEYDVHAYLLPASSVDVTYHVVQEGIYFVKYSRYLNDEMQEDPVFESASFIPNEEIPEHNYSYPYILPMDKCELPRGRT